MFKWDFCLALNWFHDTQLSLDFSSQTYVINRVRQNDDKKIKKEKFFFIMNDRKGTFIVSCSYQNGCDYCGNPLSKGSFDTGRDCVKEC